MDDTISRQAAIEAILHNQEVYSNNFGDDPIDRYTIAIIDNDAQTIAQLPSAQPEPRWIPVKTRPMDEEERKYYLEELGWSLDDNEAVMFDSLMPGDGQEIWVCSKCGNVWQDTCEVDEGIGLEGNGDWDDIVAWMPYERPSPWKGEAE